MIRIILGSPRHLQERWIKDYQQGILQGPTFVPNETLAHYLLSLLQRQGKVYPLPAIRTLWDYARSGLPQNANVAPIGMEHQLAVVLARDLGNELPHQVPGIYLNIIRHALELRRQHVQLPSYDGIPWPRILAWLEDIWPDTLYDEFRVYQYASTVLNVSTSTSWVAIYGYVEAHESQWQLLEKLSHHYSIIVYSPWLTSYENILTEDWIKRWQQQGASTEVLKDDSLPVRESVVRVRPGTLTLHAIIEEIKDHADHDVLLALTGIDAIPLTRLAKRRGLNLAQPHSVLYSAKYVWQAFWRLARGVQHDTDLPLWLESVTEKHDEKEAREFLTRWSESLRRVKNWHEVSDLFHDAAYFHDQEDLRAALSACSNWDIYDQWNIVPYPELVDNLQALLGFTAPYTVKGNTVWAEGLNVRGLSADVIIVAALKEGSFPRQRSSHSLWSPELAQLYRLPGDDHLHQQDLHLLHLLKESARQKICWMAAAGDEGVMWYLGDSGDNNEKTYRAGPELLYPDRTGTNKEQIVRHYQSHYDEEILDDYQGVVGPEMGETLWPSSFTPTQLEHFGTCPLAYFYEYILGIEPLPYNLTGNVAPAKKGQWMHKVLEEAVQLKNGLTAREMRQLLDAVIRLYPPSQPVLEAVMRHQTEDMLRDLLQAWPLIRPRVKTTVATEYRVRGEMPTDLGMWPFEGRLDRIDQAQDGIVTIIDYKTGAVKNPNHLSADNLQLPLYYDVMKERFPDKPIMAKVQGVSSANHFQSWDIEPDSQIVGMAQQIVNQMAWRIRRGDFLPLPRLDQDPCRICAFAHLCPNDIKTIRRRKNASDANYWNLWEQRG